MNQLRFATPILLQQWAADWVKTLPLGTFILLSGELGAGKTTFVQGLARGLDISEPVTSPTFPLMQIYEGSCTLVHCDLYRLKPQEVWGLDLQEGWEQAIVAIEWAERLPFRPLQAVYVHLQDTGEGRCVTLGNLDYP